MFFKEKTGLIFKEFKNNVLYTHIKFDADVRMMSLHRTHVCMCHYNHLVRITP